MTNPVTERLLALAVEQTGMSREEVLAAIEKPEWERAQKCHDWRNHVSDALQLLWDGLSVESRVVALLSALDIADSEDWDARLA